MSWCGGGEIRPTPGRRVPRLRDPRVHLVAGQLAALAGLRALRHLDLQVVGVHEVLARHAEAARRDLLDRAAPRVAVGVAARSGRGPRRPRRCSNAPPRRFIAIASVLVRLLADRAVAHRAGREPLHDRRRPARPRRSAPARARRAFSSNRPRNVASRFDWSSTSARVLLEDVVATAARRVLQLEDGVGVEQVVLALAAPLVLAAHRQLAVRELRRAGRGTRCGDGPRPRSRSRRGRCPRCATRCR